MAETGSSPRILTSAIMKAVRAMRASAFIAAIAAALTAFTAISVYKGEQDRLHYDRMKYTHTTYHNYVEYRRTRGQTLKCSDVLADVAANGRNITNDDLKTIMLYEGGDLVFQYDKERHAGLRECVDDDPLKKLFNEDKWDSEQTRLVMAGINKKMAWTVTVLDAALIGYYHDIGDKIVICQNFAGFLLSGRRVAGYGIPGKYLKRLMSPDVTLLREDNYPNIFRFATDVSKLSNDFAGTVDCNRLTELYPEKPYLTRLRDWSAALYRRWIG